MNALATVDWTIIGDQTEVRHGAYIRGNCLIGRHCVVGHVTEVKHTIFLDGAKEYAAGWLFPGGSSCNKDAYEGHVKFAPGIADEMQMLLHTPETSGGLLISVAHHDADRLAELFSSEGQQFWVVGEVVEGAAAIEVV